MQQLRPIAESVQNDPGGGVREGPLGGLVFLPRGRRGSPSMGGGPGGDVSVFHFPSADSGADRCAGAGDAFRLSWRFCGWARRSWPACTARLPAPLQLLCAQTWRSGGGHKFTLAYRQYRRHPGRGSPISCRGLLWHEGEELHLLTDRFRRRRRAHLVW